MNSTFILHDNNNNNNNPYNSANNSNTLINPNINKSKSSITNTYVQNNF